MPVVEVVKYFWREFYARITYDSGKTWHSDPWLSEEAAQICARMFRERLAQGRSVHPW